MPHLSFFKYWVLSWLFHFPLSLSSTGFLVTLRFLPLEWYHLHFWGCFSQQSWFQLVMCSAYRLNKLGENIEPCTHFSILNQSVIPYKVLTVASRSVYRFLRKHVRWSSIPTSFKSFPQSAMIHTVKGFSIVNETVDVFLEFPCFLYDLANVGN